MFIVQVPVSESAALLDDGVAVRINFTETKLYSSADRSFLIYFSEEDGEQVIHRCPLIDHVVVEQDGVEQHRFSCDSGITEVVTDREDALAKSRRMRGEDVPRYEHV